MPKRQGDGPLGHERDRLVAEIDAGPCPCSRIHADCGDGTARCGSPWGRVGGYAAGTHDIVNCSECLAIRERFESQLWIHAPTGELVPFIPPLGTIQIVGTYGRTCHD